MRTCAAIAALAVLIGALPDARAESKSANPDHKIVRSARAMGTVVHLTVWGEDDRAAAEAFAEIVKEFERIEALMTSWTDDSTIARINKGAGGWPVTVDDETFAVTAKAVEISKLTGGAFDITVGVFHNLWRFGTNRADVVPEDAEIARRVALVGYRRIKLDPRKKTIRLTRKGMGVTLGGIAKGYAVDRAVAIMHERGFVDFILQFGGDLYVSGKKGDQPWRVGIRDPRGDRETPFAVAAIQDKTFSTSGDYERSFIKDGVRYHHILDPKTGRPAMRCRSVTVMAKDAMTADGLSTALFVMGVDKGLKLVEKLPDVEAVFVDADNKLHVSSGLEGKLFVIKPPTDGV